MAIISFPEPKDLQVDFIGRTGDSRPKSFGQYDVTNPHPGYGKDPNILNEFGHTKYPMYVGTVIVNNPEEERVARGEPLVTEEKLPSVDWKSEPVLRDDGPTVQEWVAAGFKAKDYPPKGWAAISSQEEIDEAIQEEAEAEADAAASGWGK
jgi:hypothetical protein